MVGKSLVLPLLLLLPAVPARAVFVKGELDVVDPEPLYDSEYFLDLLSFSYPLDWSWPWETRPSSAAYRVNAASLDRADLLLEQELRLRRPLLPPPPGLEFRYDLLHRGDKDLESFHQWLALEAGLGRGWSAGVFGEPTFAKEDADIGALLRWRGGALELHAAADAVDFNFNERGRTQQRYDRKPYTLEAGAAWTGGGGAARVSLEYDAPLARKDPALNLVYDYRRTTLLARWDRASPEGDARIGFSAAYRYEYKREAGTFTPDPAARTLDFRRAVHALQGAAVLPLGGRDRFEAGTVLLSRAAASGSPNSPGLDVRYRRWELQPYGRWRRRARAWAVTELGLFLSAGETRRSFPSNPAAGVRQTPVDAKLGTGVDFTFAGDGRIGLYGAFDLDDAGRHLWDGGNIRAQLAF